MVCLGRFACLPALLSVALLLGAPQARPAVVRAQSASGDDLLHELAERLLSATALPGPFGSNLPSSVQLLPGALPSDLPFTPPLPANSTLIGSAERPSYPQAANGSLPLLSATSPAPTGVHVDIVLDVSDTPAGILSFYQNEMANLGWSPPPHGFQFPGGGFLPSSGPAPTSSASFCQSQNGPWMRVAVTPTTSGPQDVRLSLDTGNAQSCNPPSPPPGFPFPGSDVLPSLQAPSDASVRPFGSAGGGGSGRASSEAVAATDMSSAGLQAFYAQELAAAGWTQLDAGSAGPLTWSTWSVPNQANQTDWQGFLYVRDGPGQGLHSLHVEAMSPSLVASGGSGFSVGSTVTTFGPLGTGATPSTGIDIGTPTGAGMATPVPTPSPTPAPAGP